MAQVISEFGTIVGSPNSDIQVGTMPTYTDVPLGTIVQFIGTTDANYTNGYFYKRNTSGWEQANVQPATDVSSKADKTDITSILATGATNTTGSTITSGTYFYLNGDLVKALADIADGASYTSGTNYEAVTVGNQLVHLSTRKLAESGTASDTVRNKLVSLASTLNTFIATHPDDAKRLAIIRRVTDVAEVIYRASGFGLTSETYTFTGMNQNVDQGYFPVIVNVSTTSANCFFGQYYTNVGSPSTTTLSNNTDSTQTANFELWVI